MTRIIPLFAALALSACATMQPPAAPRAEAIAASADATAAVLDAMGSAPPATLTKTVIDDKAIRAAFLVWDKTLTVIEAFIDSGYVKPGSDLALRLRRGVLATTAALNAASAAQRAGSATTYSDALDKARLALDDIQLALAIR